MQQCLRRKEVLEYFGVHIAAAGVSIQSLF